MGKGLEEARKIAPEHAAVMDDMKEQLILVLIGRLGGKVEVSVEEIDDTYGKTLLLRVDFRTRAFHFEIREKQ